MLAPHLCRKQQRQHAQQHVVPPASPLAHLIVAHSYFTFSVLQGSLDEVTLALHEGEALGFGTLRRIGKRVLDFLRRVDFPSKDQVPVMSPIPFPIPQPHPAM